MNKCIQCNTEITSLGCKCFGSTNHMAVNTIPTDSQQIISLLEEILERLNKGLEVWGRVGTYDD